MTIRISEEWRNAYPDAHAGFLSMQGVHNPTNHPDLEGQKRKLERELRVALAGPDPKTLETHAVLQAYASYYKKFGKTYHVRAQLESIVFKGKSLPNVAALVEAMFMAEVKNLILTAGHDFDRLRTLVTVSVAHGSESYTLLKGQEQVLKSGDMYMADEGGVISSIVYGPDQRTQITAQTRSVLFAAYAPAGIEASVVLGHLQDIRDYVLIVSPDATVEMLQVYGGSA
jgi:DNA/RNA-binding domain of Phe-tRNA-synthetase-like protein